MKRKHLKNIGLVLLVLSLLLTACGSESTGYMQGADRALPLSDQTTASEQEEKQEISSESTSLTEKDSIETTDLPDVDADSNTEPEQTTEDPKLQEEESIAASRSEEESIAASKAEAESIAASIAEVESIAASKAEAESIAASIAAAQTTVPARSQRVTYIGNANSKKFHFPDCKSVKRMNEENKVFFYGDRSELLKEGYAPCKNCNP